MRYRIFAALAGILCLALAGGPVRGGGIGYLGDPGRRDLRIVRGHHQENEGSAPVNLANLNFGIGDFTKAHSDGAGLVAPLAGTTCKTLGQWERMFLSGRETELERDTTLRAPLEQSTWVQSALALIVDQITPLKLEWYRSAEDTEPLAIDGERAAWWTHPARNHAGLLSLADTIEIAGAWLKLKGIVHFILTDEWLTSATVKPPFYIGRPDRLRAIQERGTGELIGWQWSNCGEQIPLIPDQVITLRKANPYDEIGGLSAYDAVHLEAEADRAAAKFALNVSASNGQKGEYIVTDGPAPTDAQQQAIVASLREKKRRTLAGDFAPVFLAGGLRVEDPKIAAVDAAFIAQRIENRHAVYAGMGVPMSFADVKSAYSLGADSDSRQLVQGASMPLAQKLAGGFANVEGRRKRLGAASVLYAAFGWRAHPVMKAVLMGNLEAAERLFGMGVPLKEINQVLDLGLPSIEGDDTGWLPINLQTVKDAQMGLETSMNAGSSTATPVQPDEQDLPAKGRKALAGGFAALIEAVRGATGPKTIEAKISTANNAKGEGGAPEPTKVGTPLALTAAAVGGVPTPQPVVVNINLSSQGAGVSLGGSPVPTLDEITDDSSTAHGVRGEPATGFSTVVPLETKLGGTIQLGARGLVRKKLWLSHQAKRAPWERKLKAAVAKVFGRYRALALEKLAQWGTSLGYKADGVDAAMPVKSISGTVQKGGFNFIITLPDLQTDLLKATTPVLKATMEAAGAELAEEAQEPHAAELAPQSVHDFLKTRENKIQGAGQTTFDRVTDSLAEGYDKGETMDQLTQRVKDEFAGASDEQARTIAVTETGTAYSAARMISMHQAGIEYKEWLTAHDNRVRHDHQEMDGVTLAIDEPFEMPDGSKLMAPCDPNGPADQVINCRCIAVAALKKGAQE